MSNKNLRSQYKITPIPLKLNEKRDKNCLFPTPLRCLIVGGSGSGKTTLIWNIITKNWLIYKNLYIFSKSINQPAYIELKKIYTQIEEEIGKEIAFFFNNCEDIIPLDDCEQNSLIIFDDCILEQQTVIKEYFVRGRHKNISCIYLSQCYSLVDLKTIRNNLNFLCIFKQKKHYVKMIYNDFIGSDVKFERFQTICTRCWNDDYGFVSIDLTKKIDDGRLKTRFNCLS